MSVTDESRGGLSRRRFLAVTAAGLGVTMAGYGLVACTPKPTEAHGDENASPNSAEEIYSGVCRGFCTGACFLNLHMREGKLVRTTARDLPDTRYNRICAKGLTHAHRLYSPHRIQYPLRRTGVRGSGEFERISWDEAIAAIAEKWTAIISEYGNSAIGAYAQTGNIGYLCGGVGGSMFARFKQALGITTVDGVFDRAAKFSISRMLGVTPYYTGNEPTDYQNAKTMFVWGAHPAVAQIHNTHFITEARDKGTQVVYLDPIYNQSAALANQWVPLVPGSDGALAMGMISVVLDNGWQDTEFLKSKSVAPFLVKRADHKFLRLSDLGKAEAGSEDDLPLVMANDGSHDTVKAVADPQLEVVGASIEGIEVDSAYSLLLQRVAEYPLERASELSGVSAETIQDLARQFAQDTPASLYTVFGADHYYNGHWNYSCMTTLAIITGNVGRSGSFVGSYELPGAGFVNMKAALDVEPPVTPKKVNIPRMTEIMENQTYNGEPYTMKSLFITCANPVVNIGNRQGTLSWLDKLDFIVASDVTMTETCEWADIVLPACHWFECEEIVSQLTSHPHVMYQEKVLEPAFESKPDFEIYKLIADAMGLGESFNYTEKEYFDKIFDSEAAVAQGISYDTLKSEKALRWLPGSDFVSFAEGAFTTPTGRAQFYIEEPKPSNDYKEGWDFEKEYLPYWEPPRESWKGTPLQQKYPLHLISDKSRYRTHTQWGDIQVMLELDPEPYVNVSVEDAATYGITTGDTVRLFNDRGYVVIKTRVISNIPQGVLLIPKGWSKSQYLDGHYSDLTSEVMNGFCGNQPFFDAVVGLEKA